MRTVSSKFRKALYAQETDEVAACLMTITHPELGEPIRVSTDPTTRLSVEPLLYGTKSRGQDYLFVPMEVVVPGEEDQAQEAKLEVDNTDQGLINAIRSISNAALVKLEIVLPSDPDVVEREYPALMISHVEYDERTVRFTLALDALTTEPYPGTAFIPSMFPGLF